MNYKDLVKRLRKVTVMPEVSPTSSSKMIIYQEVLRRNVDGAEAADAIEVQANRIADLEAALKTFADKAIYVDEIDYDFLVSVKAIDLRQARKVLGEKE